MQLEVLRFNDNGNSTNGLLFDVSDGKNTFLCYTLEDEDRLEKVYGKTRIPEGEYNICFRSVGGFNTRYSKRFAGIHMGMLEIMDVTDNVESVVVILLLGVYYWVIRKLTT